MPTSTFFRLPEEKRKRLMDAAWEEFNEKSFADVSINKIILKARIPRGSFYQYFADKEDLFRHILAQSRDYFIQILNQMLESQGGDLFAVPLWAFDQLIQRSESSQREELNRFVQLLRLNAGMDMQQFLICQQDILPGSVLQRLDLKRLRRKDTFFLEQVFMLLMVCTATAIAETLIHPEKQEQQREFLRARVDILAHGSLEPQYIAT